MAAPSKDFTVIADSRVDTDSPVDTTLVTDMRDNDIHLEEAMGRDYVLAVNHDHDDVNSKGVVVPAGSITISQISRAEQVIFDDFTEGTLRNTWVDTSVGVTFPDEAGGKITWNSGEVYHAAKIWAAHATDAITFEVLAENAGTAPSGTGNFYFGLSEDGTSTFGNLDEGIAFARSPGSPFTNWYARNVTGGVFTSTDTGIAVSTSQQKLKMIILTTSIEFYIDDVLVATNTTNIPTDILLFAMQEDSTNFQPKVDYISCDQPLTR